MTEYKPIFWDIETTGLNPMAQPFWDGGVNEVVVVVVATVENWEEDIEDVETDITVFSGDSEYKLIKEVREGMHSILSGYEGWDDNHVEPLEGSVNPEAFFVGYNNRSFDHPFYCARAGRLRQSPWPFGHQRKRLDAYRVTTKRLGYPYTTSQDDLAESIGIELGEDTIDGKDVPRMVEEGKIDLVENHCRTDIEDLVQIFLHKRHEMMMEFFEHYDIDQDPSYGGDVTIDL